MTCSHCFELLLDYLYGLLDEEPARQLRDHLAGCPACQAGLDQAKGRQNLFARAACKFRDVPVFHLPADELEPLGAAVPAPAAARIPARRAAATAVPGGRIPWRWRRWTAAVAAASLLLAVTVSYAQYQGGLDQRQAALRDSRQEVERVDAFFTSFISEFKREDANLDQDIQKKSLHLHVLGPATYHPGASSVYRVTTLTPEGKPASARVSMRVIVRPPDQEVDQFLYKLDEERTVGELRLELPKLAVPAGTTPQLVIEAHNDYAREVVKKPLPVEEPTFLTHLTVNKSALRAGDILFFRTVTLERCSLAPLDSDHQVTLGFTLYRLTGPKAPEAVKQLQGSTDAGGIAGGEFAITEDLAEGDYLLSAAEIVPDGQKGHGVRPVMRHLRIIRDGAPPPVPQIVLDQKQYQAGQTINGQFRGQTPKPGLDAANQAVTVKAMANKEALRMLQLRTDPQGNAYFNIPLPTTMAPGDVQLELQLHDGVANGKFKQTVPVVRPTFTAEFFPEGGYLVAGMPNCVYFRMHVPLWAPPGLICTLEDDKQHKVADVEISNRAGAGQLALGRFTFTPRFGQLYRFHLTAGDKHDDYLPMPKVKQNGLVLNAPVSVVSPIEPVRVRLGTTQKNAEVLIVASCRGRIVDQKQVVTTGLWTDVMLEPASGASGVLRVTVFEKHQKEWRPAAERLIYRVPGEYLKLSALPNKGTRRAYPPGDAVTLQLEARNEVNALTPTWLHFLVIDARAQQATDYAQPGPGSYFFMTNELREPEDLENADFLLADAPGAQQALDLYLGTQGWRRFLDTPDSNLAKLTESDATNAAIIPELFVGGTRIENVKDRSRREINHQRENLWKESRARLEALEIERNLKANAAQRAAEELADFTQMPLHYLRPAVGLAFWLLIGAGALLLLAGLVVALRGQRSPRFCLVSAFCTLLCGVLLYATTARLRTAQDGEPVQEQLAWLKPQTWSLGQPVPALAMAEPARDRAERDKVEFETWGPTRVTTRTAGAKDSLNAVLASAVDATKKYDQIRQLVQTTPELAALQNRTSASVQLLERFESTLLLEEMAKAGSFGGGKAKSAMAEKKGQPGVAKTPEAVLPYSAADKPADGKTYTALAREYAPFQGKEKQDYQDTVLWSPALSAANGTASVTFYLSAKEATYRVVIYGHTSNGRMGVFHGKLQAK